MEHDGSVGGGRAAMAMLSHIQVSASVGFSFIFSLHPSPIRTQIPGWEVGGGGELKRNLGKIRQEGVREGGGGQIE